MNANVKETRIPAIHYIPIMLKMPHKRVVASMNSREDGQKLEFFRSILLINFVVDKQSLI